MSDTPAPDPLDPHSLDHVANAHAPLDGEDGDIASPLADTVQATGNGAAHDDDELPEVGDDPAATRLEPNRADINKHLYALFHPDFVMAYPDAWIEIAYANPAAGGGLRAAEQFSAFELEAAGDFAERKNRKGFNIYVGVALRQGETPATSNGRASGANVLTACRAWTDFDGEGDAARVEAILKDKDIRPAEVVTTGTIPHRRFQVHFELLGKPSEDGLDPGNPTADELTAVNTALKELLGGDDVQNADRVMRLAGTVSYPSPGKVERGYVPELVTLAGNGHFARLSHRRADRAGHRRCRSIARVWASQQQATVAARATRAAAASRRLVRPGPSRAATPSSRPAEDQPDRRQMVGFDAQRDGDDDRARHDRRRDQVGVRAVLHRRLRR